MAKPIHGSWPTVGPDNTLLEQLKRIINQDFRADEQQRAARSHALERFFKQADNLGITADMIQRLSPFQLRSLINIIGRNVRLLRAGFDSADVLAHRDQDEQPLPNVITTLIDSNRGWPAEGTFRGIQEVLRERISHPLEFAVLTYFLKVCKTAGATPEQLKSLAPEETRLLVETIANARQTIRGKSVSNMEKERTKTRLISALTNARIQVATTAAQNLPSAMAGTLLALQHSTASSASPAIPARSTGDDDVQMRDVEFSNTPSAHAGGQELRGGGFAEESPFADQTLGLSLDDLLSSITRDLALDDMPRSESDTGPSPRFEDPWQADAAMVSEDWLQQLTQPFLNSAASTERFGDWPGHAGPSSGAVDASQEIQDIDWIELEAFLRDFPVLSEQAPADHANNSAAVLLQQHLPGQATVPSPARPAMTESTRVTAAKRMRAKFQAQAAARNANVAQNPTSLPEARDPSAAELQEIRASRATKLAKAAAETKYRAMTGLGLTHSDILRIAKYSAAAFDAIVTYHSVLTAPEGAQLPGGQVGCGFDTNAVVQVAASRGGAAALQQVARVHAKLRAEPYELPAQDIVRIASYQAGQTALVAVEELFVPLKAMGLSTKVIVSTAAGNSGSAALRSLNELFTKLTGAERGFTREEVAKIARGQTGSSALQMIDKRYDQLRRIFSNAQIAAMNKGGAKVLEKCIDLHTELSTASFGLSTEQVVAIASNSGGAQALEKFKQLHAELRAAPFGLSTAQIVAVASNNGGAQALEKVKQLHAELRAAPFGLSTSQIVAVANNDGGAQALERFKQLHAVLLATPFGLSTEQIAAIASNDGGAKALDEVATHYGTLIRPPFSQSQNQIVALAAQKSGANALLQFLADNEGLN